MSPNPEWPEAMRELIERARNEELKDVLAHIRARLHPPAACDHCDDMELRHMLLSLAANEHRGSNKRVRWNGVTKRYEDVP